MYKTSPEILHLLYQAQPIMSTPPPHLQRSGTFRFLAHPSSFSLPRSVTPSSDKMSLIMSENDSTATRSYYPPKFTTVTSGSWQK